VLARAMRCRRYAGAPASPEEHRHLRWSGSMPDGIRPFSSPARRASSSTISLSMIPVPSSRSQFAISDARGQIPEESRRRVRKRRTRCYPRCPRRRTNILKVCRCGLRAQREYRLFVGIGRRGPSAPKMSLERAGFEPSVPPQRRIYDFGSERSGVWREARARWRRRAARLRR
jgi:hypothetical protein